MILFVNFLLVTVVVFGGPRFISVIDSFFMLTAITLLVSFALRFLIAPKVSAVMTPVPEPIFTPAFDKTKGTPHA